MPARGAFHDRFQRCFGIPNALVAWDRLRSGMVEAVLARIPREHFALIFERMAANLGPLRVGFPDLRVIRVEREAPASVHGMRSP